MSAIDKDYTHTNDWVFADFAGSWQISEDCIYRNAQKGVVITAFQPQTYQDTVVVPSEIDGKPVWGIARTTFKNLACDYGEPIYRNHIQKLIIEEGIEFLDKGVFQAIDNIHNVLLPHSLKIIGPHCFDTSGIEQISSMDNIQYIGEYAFSGMWRIEEIEIDGTTECIPHAAFSSCSACSIVIPSLVKDIQTSAFYGAKIEYLVIPNGLRKIGMYAFSECSHLKRVSIPSSVRGISDNSFDPPEKNPLLTFYVYPNSYGLMWARERGYPVKSAEI